MRQNRLHTASLLIVLVAFPLLAEAQISIAEAQSKLEARQAQKKTEDKIKELTDKIRLLEAENAELKQKLAIADAAGHVLNEKLATATRAPAPAPAPPPTTQPSQQLGKNVWTKDQRPAWATRLDDKVTTSFENVMKDESPVITGIGYSAEENRLTLLITRTEWAKLSSSQARNWTMLCAVLPHDPQTIVTFMDNRSKVVLTKFQMSQPFASISVTHP